MYRAAEAGWLDIVRVAGRLVQAPVALTGRAHSGVLSTYALWLVLGLCGVLLVYGGMA